MSLISVRSSTYFVKKEYYSVTGRCYIKTQTALLLTLKYHLSDNEELTKAQLRKLFDENDGKLKTGFVGTPLMCNILTENGMDDIAYGLLLNEEYPGWLSEVKLGATTVWERWNSLLGDGTISGIGMNSMNHYAYGSILEWMFRHAAGINTTDDAPGLRRVVFEPVLNWELRCVRASYDSPCGLYRCAWHLTDPAHVELEVEVPFGGSAKLCLPLAPASVMNDRTNPMFSNIQDGSCLLSAGTYKVCYELTKPLGKKYSLDGSTVRELFGNSQIAEFMEKELALDIPVQYMDNTVKETAALFPPAVTDWQIKRLGEYLQQL